MGHSRVWEGAGGGDRVYRFALYLSGDAPIGTFNTFFHGPSISGGVTAFTGYYNVFSAYGILTGSGGPLTRPNGLQ